jgi:hypothetical protein
MINNNIVKYTLVFFIFIASFIGTKYIIKNYIKTNKSVEEHIKSINDSCPKKMDGGIVLDSINIKNNDLNYYYTFIYEDKDKWDITYFEKFMKPRLIKLYQKSEEKSILDSYNYILNYHYQDGFQTPISKIIITPKEYKK